MIARIRDEHGAIRHVPLCESGGTWVPIEAGTSGTFDYVEAARVCAAHLRGMLARALSAAHRRRASLDQDEETASREYLTLATELLAQANIHAARLLDAPWPEDELAEGIELAEPERTANEMFLGRVLALSAQVQREAGAPVDAWALELVAQGLADMAQERTAESADEVLLRLVGTALHRAQDITGQPVTREGLEEAITHLRRQFQIDQEG